MQATQKGDSQTPRTPRETTATYKMPKSVKTLMSTLVDAHARGHFKRMMIGASVTAQKHAAEASKRRDKNQD